MNRINPLTFGLYLLLCFSAGFLGSIPMPEMSWYNELIKPEITPPGWVFPIVWPILYTMMACSAYLLHSKGSKTKWARVFFLVHLVVNTSWSFVFFSYHNIALALAVLVLLWGMILTCILWFRKYSGLAAWLLVPYLAWTSFAGILNALIYTLNP